MDLLVSRECFVGFSCCIGYIIWRVFLSSRRIPGEKLGGNDLIWLFDTPTNQAILHGVFHSDKWTLNDLEQVVLDRIIQPNVRFKQKLVRTDEGEAYWTDNPNFDISNHVMKAAVGQSSFSSVTPKQLEQYIGEISNSPISFEHCPFQVLLVENYQANQSVVIARIHHVVADGIGLLNLVNNMRDTHARDQPSHPNSTPPEPSSLKLLGKLVRFPYAMYQNLFSRSKLASTPLSGKRLIARGHPIPSSEVKFVKSIFKCTVNDVLIAALTGAFRRYAALTSDTSDIQDVVTTVPVSMRSRQDLKNIDLNNQMSLIAVDLPVSIADPVARLHEAKLRMDEIKQSVKPYANYMSLLAMEYTWTKFNEFIVQHVASKSSSVLATVIGSSKRIKIQGREVHDMCFFVPSLGNIGRGVSILSYAGSVVMSVTCDEQVCKLPHKFVEAFNEEFQVLLNVAKQKYREAS